jgi:hypothetical protein
MGSRVVRALPPGGCAAASTVCLGFSTVHCILLSLATHTPASPLDHRTLSTSVFNMDPTTAAALADPRRHVRVEPERVRDVSSVDYPGHFPNEDHSWDLDRFRQVRTSRMSMICLNHIPDQICARLGSESHCNTPLEPVHRV